MKRYAIPIALVLSGLIVGLAQAWWSGGHESIAEAAAARLPDGEALLLRGNGAITLGAAPGLGVARMWLLATACQAFLAARAAGPVTPLSPAEIESWRTVSGELLPRLWHHLRRRPRGQRHGYDDAGGTG